jgi:hypothetical protein
MTKEQAMAYNAKMINKLCRDHGCNEKVRKIHWEQMVLRAWNPHPSAEFVAWWQTQVECRESHVSAVKARNCKKYCDRYKEAVEHGMAEYPVDYAPEH